MRRRCFACSPWRPCFRTARVPTVGVFVERQTQALAARAEVEVEVVAPVGLPVWPLSLHPALRAAPQLPERERWNGLDVHRPRYRVWPGIGQAGTARAMARGAAAAAPRHSRALPVRRDRRRIFLARRPGGDAPGRRRSACPSRSRRGAATFTAGARRPGHQRADRGGGTGGRGPARGQRRAARRHDRARHAGGEDPGPPYRHRPRPLPAARPPARPEKAAADHRRPPDPAQGTGSRARGAGRNSRTRRCSWSATARTGPSSSASSGSGA